MLSKEAIAAVLLSLEVSSLLLSAWVGDLGRSRCVTPAEIIFLVKSLIFHNPTPSEIPV